MTLAKRNLKLYFDDKLGVFFSLLGVLIIIILYAVFLGDSMEVNMSELKDPALSVDIWLTAGILQVASMTTSLGSFSVLIQDRLSGKNKDFYMLPISKRKVSQSYFISAFIVGALMTVAVFAVCCIYLYVKHSYFLGFFPTLQTLALIFATSLASSSISYIIASCLSSNSAFSAVSTIIGTLIGFMTGIYFPVGSVSQPVQKAMTVFPLSHGASLFRKIFMDGVINTEFADAPPEIVQEFTRELGVDLFWNDTKFSAGISIVYILLFSVFLYVISDIVMKKRYDTAPQ